MTMIKAGTALLFGRRLFIVPVTHSRDSQLGYPYIVQHYMPKTKKVCQPQGAALQYCSV